MTSVSRAHSRQPSNHTLPNNQSINQSISDDPIDPDAPVMKACDMNQTMEKYFINFSQKLLVDIRKNNQTNSQTINQTIAKTMKQEFDREYGGFWHCVVGRNFGSFVVHESGTFAYCYVGGLAILLFKSGRA